VGGHLCTLAVVTLGRRDDIRPQARVVLLDMASVARDRGETPGIYWAGWAHLAQTLGYPTYSPTAHRAVARAVRELIDAKLIRPINEPGRGRQAYEITLPDPLT